MSEDADIHKHPDLGGYIVHINYHPISTVRLLYMAYVLGIIILLISNIVRTGIIFSSVISSLPTIDPVSLLWWTSDNDDPTTYTSATRSRVTVFCCIHPCLIDIGTSSKVPLSSSATALVVLNIVNIVGYFVILNEVSRLLASGSIPSFVLVREH